MATTFRVTVTSGDPNTNTHEMLAAALGPLIYSRLIKVTAVAGTDDVGEYSADVTLRDEAGFKARAASSAIPFNEVGPIDATSDAFDRPNPAKAS